MAPPNLVKQAFSAARGILKVGGTPIGWATGFRAEEAYSQFPIDVLGDVYTQTHELVGVKVSGSFDRFRVYNEPLAHATGNNGALWYNQANDTPDLIKLLEKEFTLEDTANSSTTGGPAAVYTIIGWKPSSRSITYNNGSVLMESCAWVAIRIIESKVEPVLTLEPI
jgi:hypothetical protein